MPVSITFCDLRHTGHACNTVPFAAALVAAAAKSRLGERIEVDVFKDPEDFARRAETSPPRIACFSTYVWNLRLSHEFARRLKERHPETVTIFGGPNFPLEPQEQEAFLRSHPAIDFFIWREGEAALCELLEMLLDGGLSGNALKAQGTSFPNGAYLADSGFVLGPLLPRIENLDEYTSPYLTGLLDKFLGEELIPLFQTTRGCPFQCTYCQEGSPYFAKIARFSSERLRSELHYIGKRTSVPNLIAADSNFGMYKEDLETCRHMAETQAQYGWPEYFIDFAGKNNKERVLEAISIAKGAHHLSAAVQSTDANVLAAIKRQNVSQDQTVRLVKEAEQLGANSFAEVILALPRDTKQAHFRSMTDMIDAELNVVRSHQCVMLPGAECSSKETREEYALTTRFRVVPNTAAQYRFFGESFSCPEIDEICVATNSLSFDDYVECRRFDLTVEIFYNNAIFMELLRLLKRFGISASSFLTRVHAEASLPDSPLSGVYAKFTDETKELWETEEELAQLLSDEAIVEKFRNGEMGINEQLAYRAVAVFQHMEDLHDLAFRTVFDLLAGHSSFDDAHGQYLNELKDFSLSLKNDLLETQRTFTRSYNFAFDSLHARKFDDDPMAYRLDRPRTMTFFHTDEQRSWMDRYVKVFGLSDYGLGNILSNGGNVNTLYRRVEAIAG